LLNRTRTARRRFYSRRAVTLTGVASAVLIAFASPGCDGLGPDGDGGWGNNRNWAGEYLRVRLLREQHPLLGEYSSRDAGVISQHVTWATGAGIDFFCVAWRGPGTWGHETLTDYLIPDAAFDLIDWCILYETPTILAGDPETGSFGLSLTSRDSLLSHLLLFHDSFFSLPNYLHLGGLPVIVMRQTHKISGDARIALNAVRQAYADSTGGGAFYLIGDEVIWGASAVPNLSRISAMDAVTGIDLATLTIHDGYPAGSGVIEDLADLWESYTQTLAGMDDPIPLIPTVMPGYNDRASSDILRPIITRELTLTLTAEAGTYRAIWDLANTWVGEPAIVLLNSFNVWRQDTQIEYVADNSQSSGTTLPNTATGGYRYFPYQNLYLDETALRKGDVLLGAIYEVWYDNHPPGG